MQADKFKVADGTVYYIDEYNEHWDLNVEGEPIRTDKELKEFIDELWLQYYFDGDTAKQLIDNV